ncbi:glycosyl transferase family 1 [Agreia sp. Leaf335]|uniref:glycosyltransferase family 4 protein n=1 Tax=Agreia sp. Leaf335 TaxID=1736340 RepID=UPI0006FBD37C|nr:glycosyltransferase family 4 protein [Agreia sp. Leaf335]KQR24028.1 glycosyl transferase family 1 [Agreia sp. Leaf335]
MTGSEWFSSRQGGLNRYFEGLYLAMAATPEVQVSGAAFGDPAAGGTSWGPTGGSTVSRVLASRRAPEARRLDIVDKHFSLYGSPRAPKTSPDAGMVVHFQGPWAAESAVAGANKLVTRAKTAVERSSYKHADAFVVLSRPFKEILANDYGVSADKIHIIPPGVDIDDFEFSEETTNSGAAPRVLCVRRLEKRMGIDVLIKAWAEVDKRIPGAELRIVGSGTFEQELRAMAAASPAKITFLGRLDDETLRQEYRSASITAVPSLALEGFGLIALESLATGRAPIVTDCGGLPDAVRGLDASLIVPRGSVEALADRIVHALLGRVPSAHECRAHAETFAWNVIAQRHLALYEEVR